MLKEGLEHQYEGNDPIISLSFQVPSHKAIESSSASFSDIQDSDGLMSNFNKGVGGSSPAF